MYHGCARCTIFKELLSTTDGKTDVGARPAGSWNPIRQFLGRECLPTRGSASYVRILSRTCPERALRARARLSGTHYRRAHRIREVGRRDTCEFVATKLSGRALYSRVTSRDSSPFFTMLLLSYTCFLSLSDLFWGGGRGGCN